MAIEIERKYLVDSSKLPELTNGRNIIQAYICSSIDKSVRIRIRDKEAFLTVKSGKDSISRLEYEYSIPLKDAEQMLEICTSSISKTRYDIEIDSLIWEIDVFHNHNEGLIIAEVELESVDQQIPLPAWIKQEVSSESKYLNVSLIKNPFKSW